jgi:hypothetical protein
VIAAHASSVLAVALAAAGAVLFGLAAVRQHDAVRAVAGPAPSGLRQQVGAGLRLVRQPAWLLGGVQAGLGGGLHVVALTLAPITLVQPVGVLAVPVTVVVSALARHRRPGTVQVVGTVLTVVGVAALTVVLLLPASRPASLPSWSLVATGTGVVLVGTGGVALLLGRAPAVLRCVTRALVAAVLFGLGSVLVRTLGEVVATAADHPGALVLTALCGIALALPLGGWAVQSAYLFGPPQVVICCLTVVDPLTAVVGGRVLLQDGADVTGGILAAALGCGLVAVAGIVLLARGYPTGPAAPAGP